MKIVLRARAAALAAALLLAAGSGCSAGNGAPARGAVPTGGMVYPRVLFLTTGSDGAGLLPSGANVCLETFNALGVFTEIADKSVLLSRNRLDSVRIIVAPTIAGYHDADRVFSLSFLDEASMTNLVDWVGAGGIFIAGENVGRNTLEGEDRVASGNLLDEQEWPLARVFGYTMREQDLRGFRLVKDSAAPLLAGFRPDLSQILDEAWVLVPADSVDPDCRTLARWTDGLTSYSAVTLNACGRGFGIMVPYFLLLQPSVDGGAGDVAAIAAFYRGVFALALGDGPPVYVNPWPGPYRSALAVTLTETGDSTPGSAGLSPMLDRLLAVPGLRRLDVFVSGQVPQPTLDRLRGEPRISLASLGFSHRRFGELDYCGALWEIARFEGLLGGPVRGFRFPFSSRTAAGMFVLAQRRYRYDSSVFLDHASGFAGALFPYNMPTWVRDNYCLVSDVLELSPALEDWDSYGAGATAAGYTETDQARDGQLFAARLESTWRELARSRRGMMIPALHSAYCGYSNTTLKPVTNFLAGVAAAGDAWLTGLEAIADWWVERRNVDIRVTTGANRTVLTFSNLNPGPVRGLTLRLAEPGLRASVRGVTVNRVERIEEDGTFSYLSFDLTTTAEVEVYR